MFKKKVTGQVLEAIEKSPGGIASLDVLKSLRLCDFHTLLTTLSRLNKSQRIIRLKRGAYSANPIKDAFACAQVVFNGYLGFTSALYLHKLMTEIPFTITVVTTYQSKNKQLGEYQIRAVSLKEKAIGFERLGEYVISSKAKTLFDCLYLPEYSIGRQKLIGAFKGGVLSRAELAEFDKYVEKFAGKKAGEMMETKREIVGGCGEKRKT